MKNTVIILILFLIIIGYAANLDTLLKNTANSPELLYKKLLALKPMDKNLSLNLSKESSLTTMSISYPISNDLSISGYGYYNGSVSFGLGATYTFGRKTKKENKSFWYDSVEVKLKLIDLYFDIFLNPTNKDNDEDMIKYLSNLPLNYDLNPVKPSLTLLKEDKDKLFKKFYNSITYSPYQSSFDGYKLNFKVDFQNPLEYNVSLNIPIHFDYDQLVNDQYLKIISTKMTILFRKEYRNYYDTLSQLLKEKKILDKLNDDYIKIYNENITGKVDYSAVLNQKKLLQQETQKIENLSLTLSKAAYKILVLSGER